MHELLFRQTRSPRCRQLFRHTASRRPRRPSRRRQPDHLPACRPLRTQHSRLCPRNIAPVPLRSKRRGRLQCRRAHRRRPLWWRQTRTAIRHQMPVPCARPSCRCSRNAVAQAAPAAERAAWMRPLLGLAVPRQPCVHGATPGIGSAYRLLAGVAVVPLWWNCMPLDSGTDIAAVFSNYQACCSHVITAV